MDSLNWILCAWGKVESENIKKCFSKAGYSYNEHVSITEHDHDYEDLDKMIRRSNIEGIPATEFVDFDITCLTTLTGSTVNMETNTLKSQLNLNGNDDEQEKQDDNNNKGEKINCISSEERLDYLGKIEFFLSINNFGLNKQFTELKTKIEKKIRVQQIKKKT